MDDMTKAAAGGLTDLMGLAPVVTLLVLVCMGLSFMVLFLLRDARKERNQMRDAYIANTVVMTEWKEIVRNALHRKN